MIKQTKGSLTYHLATACKNGVTGMEMTKLLTHLVFYAGSAIWR